MILTTVKKIVINSNLVEYSFVKVKPYNLYLLLNVFVLGKPQQH